MNGPSEIRLRVDALADAGDGVARQEGGDDRPWFVALTAPGDVVDARPERGAKVRRANVVRVVEPSPDRVEPPCPHFGVCGGCQWQHVVYGAQLAAKHSTVSRALSRAVDAAPAVAAVEASPAPYAYRHRVTLAARPARGSVLLGFREARSKRIVDARRCPVLAPALEEALEPIRVHLSRTLDAGPVIDLPVALDPSTGRVLVRLPPEGPRGEARFGCVEAGSVAEIDRAEAVGRYEVGGRSIAFTPGVFTQANLAANERLVARVLAELAVDPPKMLLDLYSGVGNYAIPAASLAGEIRGIEQDVDAVAMAAQAAREQDLEHLSFSALAADGALDRIVRRRQPIDACVCNPPRTGLGERVASLLAATKARRIVYVSCSPQSLARDLRVIVSAGYAVAAVRPFDLFPQTFHVEQVVTLVRG